MITHHGKTVTIFHNGDYSGSVIIYVDPDKVEAAPGNKLSVQIEFFELKTLVLKFMRDKMIEGIEEMEESDFEEWVTFSLVNANDDIYHHKFDLPVGT